ncbi:MAG: hypothetical protein AB7S61_05015 [Methanoregulaceae archaeon]
MWLAYLFQGLMVLNGVYAYVTGQLAEAFTATFMIALSVVPYVVAARENIRFPWFVYFLISFALWFHVAGYIQGFYVDLYPYYDKIAHLVSGTTIALLGFLGVIYLDKHWKMALTPLFVASFTVTFGMALGGVWEIYEFLVDLVFGGSLAGPMQNSLEDTMLDMIFVLVGSVIVAAVALVYFRTHEVDDVTESLQEIPGE